MRFKYLQNKLQFLFWYHDKLIAVGVVIKLHKIQGKGEQS